MSNKETPETYETQEKTGERDKASEKAANNLEGSSFAPPEINPPSDNPYKDYRDAADQAAANNLENHASYATGSGGGGDAKSLE